MTGTDIIVIAAVALVIFGAVAYIIKSKKSGKKCIGCPGGASCSACAHCKACHNPDSDAETNNEERG